MVIRRDSFETLDTDTVFTKRLAGTPILLLKEGELDSSGMEYLARFNNMPEQGAPNVLVLVDNKVKVTNGFSFHPVGANDGLKFWEESKRNVTVNESTPLFPAVPETKMNLPEGTELTVLWRRWGNINSSRTCWYKVKKADGKIGWVSQFAMDTIDAETEFTWNNSPREMEYQDHLYFIAPDKPADFVQQK